MAKRKRAVTKTATPVAKGNKPATTVAAAPSPPVVPAVKKEPLPAFIKTPEPAPEPSPAAVKAAVNAAVKAAIASVQGQQAPEVAVTPARPGQPETVCITNPETGEKTCGELIPLNTSSAVAPAVSGSDPEPKPKPRRRRPAPIKKASGLSTPMMIGGGLLLAYLFTQR